MWLAWVNEPSSTLTNDTEGGLCCVVPSLIANSAYIISTVTGVHTSEAQSTSGSPSCCVDILCWWWKSTHWSISCPHEPQTAPSSSSAVELRATAILHCYTLWGFSDVRSTNWRTQRTQLTLKTSISWLPSPPAEPRLAYSTDHMHSKKVHEARNLLCSAAGTYTCYLTCGLYWFPRKWVWSHLSQNTYITHSVLSWQGWKCHCLLD